MTQRQLIFLWSFFLSLLSIYATLRLQYSWLITLENSGPRPSKGFSLDLIRPVGNPAIFLLVQPMILFILHSGIHWFIYRQLIDHSREQRLSPLLLLPRRDSLRMNGIRVLLYVLLAGLFMFTRYINGTIPSTIIGLLLVIQYGWWVLEWEKGARYKAS